MSLNKIKMLFSRRLVLLVVLVGVVVGLVYINLARSPVEEVDEGVEIPVSGFKVGFVPVEAEAGRAGTVKYVGRLTAELPEKLLTYRVVGDKKVDGELADRWAKVLGIEGEVAEKRIELENGVVVYNTAENYLTVKSNPARLDWGSYGEPRKIKPEPGQAKVLAEMIIRDLELVPEGARLELADENFLEGSEIRAQEVAGSSRRANLYEMVYFVDLNGWPLVTDRMYQSNIRVVVSGDGKIYRLTSAVWPAEVQEYGSMALKTLDQAVYEIEQGRGTIVDLAQANGVEGFLEVEVEGRDFTLNRVGLGYYDQVGSDIIIPIFMFTGTAPDGAQTAVYLPAEK